MIESLVAFSLLSAAAAPPAAFLPRARPYDAQHYALELKLADDGTFHNTLTATLKPSRAVPEIELDAFGLTIEGATIDGEKAEFTLKEDAATHTGTLTVKAKKPLAAGKDAKVEITYSGKPATVHEGFFTVTDGEDASLPPYYFTHFEPTYAQRLFPCNDQPGDKATTAITAVVDAKYTVLSNGAKELDETFTDAGHSLRRVRWAQTKAHSTYLVALAIGAFEPVPVSDDIPSTVWVPKGRKDRAYVAVDVLKGLWNYQAGATGTRYPWAKLDVVALPHFFWSGMENTSIIFERESRLLVETKNDQTARSTIVGLLSHEMAHQYFGDLVTCAWWDETWLNEGFATWLGANTADDANDNDEVEVRRTRSLIEHYFHQDDGARAHALRVKNGTPGEIFDSISYSKGAQVLRMLELWVGKAELKKALKAYLEKYALGPVTSDDFFKVVFETTKKEKELKPFKDAWLNQPGYPVIFPDTSFGGGKLTVTIRQQPSRPGEKTPFVFKLPIVVHREAEPAYTQEQLITVDKAEVKVTFDVPAAPEWINWNKDFGALVKVNATSVSEDQAIDASRHDTDPTWRLVATWQLIAGLPTLGHKDEAHLSEAAMGALLDVITKDPSPYVREAVLERLLDNGLEKLPKELAAPVLAVAKRPEGLNDDAAGTIRVKNAAVELLGRLPGSEGHAWLLEQLDRRDLDINYLSGFAAGAARLGTSNALASLSTAIVTQKSRGYAYYHRAAEPLGSVASTEVVPSLKELFAANRANPELLRGVLDRLEDNTALKATPELAAFVRWVVLDEGFGDELRSAVLSVIADVKTDAAKDVLTRVVNETKSERLRLAAKKLLDANFPTALAPPAAPAPKAKK